jgi:hypothetical protein
MKKLHRICKNYKRIIIICLKKEERGRKLRILCKGKMTNRMLKWINLLELQNIYKHIGEDFLLEKIWKKLEKERKKRRNQQKSELHF